MKLTTALRAWRRRAAAWLDGHVSVQHKLALLLVALALPLAGCAAAYWITTERLTGEGKRELAAIAYLDAVWPAYATAARQPDEPLSPSLRQHWRQAAAREAGKFGTSAAASRFSAAVESHPDQIIADGGALMDAIVYGARISGGDTPASAAGLAMLTWVLPDQVAASDGLSKAMASADAQARLRAAGAYDAALYNFLAAANRAESLFKNHVSGRDVTKADAAAIAAVTHVSDLTRLYAADGLTDSAGATAFTAAQAASIAEMEKAWSIWVKAVRAQVDTDVQALSTGRRAGAAIWLTLLGLNAWLAIALARSIVRPQRALVENMNRLIAGDTSISVPYRRYANDIGDAARAIDVFRKTLVERKALQNDLEEGRRALELRVRERTQALEAANAAKTNFVATLSHEIRTPLNGVLGMAAALERTPLNGEQREMLKVITTSGDALVRLLNNAIDISRIESGKAELELGPFDLAEMVEHAASLYRETAQGKTLWLDVAIAPEAQVIYRGDAMRLRQIVQNFVSNAVKFTDRGGVSVSVSCGRIDGARTTLIFEVADTGIGLSGDPNRLFESYHQGGPSAARRRGGAGLGLWISRDLATLMGGTVDARTREGGGAVFRLTVPLERLERAPSAPAAAPLDAPRGLRALAADDNAVNLLVLRTLLEQLGVQADFVSGGRDALEAARTLPYDLLILDIRMPDLDGLAVTRAVRAGDGPNRQTPIIAVSGDAMPEQVAKHFAAGVNAHVAKPIQVSALVNAIAQVTARAEPEAMRDAAG
jgi:signal transduction histidine kinase/ActR/RegA family two-component response regulator